MPLTVRPTGLGAGIDKDRQDFTIFSGGWAVACSLIRVLGLVGEANPRRHELTGGTPCYRMKRPGMSVRTTRRDIDQQRRWRAQT